MDFCKLLCYIILCIEKRKKANGLENVKRRPGDRKDGRLLRELDPMHYIVPLLYPNRCDNDTGDSSTDSMDVLNRMPRFLSKFLVSIICWLDKHGWVPNFLIATDPYYASAVLTNLGSIKLHSGYHHLTNWGTNSLFVAIGEKKLRPFYDEAGNVTMRDSIDLGLTIDERIADGYYYSKTVRLMKKLLAEPELLEKPLSEEVEY